MGIAKQMRKGARNDWARANGRYPDRTGLFPEDFLRGSPIGPGMVRAQADMSERSKANSAIPDTEVMTRQRRRAQERAADKAERRHIKAAMMLRKIRGGMAIVR